jgi:hypothetical protein
MVTGAATATTSKIIVQPLSSVSRVVGAFDHAACIDQSGSASNPVIIEGGSGLGNDSGGGGGGGGSGGTSSAFDAAFPANGTAVGVSDGTNMKALLAPLILSPTAGVNGNNMVAGVNYLYAAGTGYIAAPGDATNGAKVQGTVTANLGTIGAAATSANQTTELASLASIDTKVGSAIPTQATSVPIGGVSNDPCSYAAKTNLPISFQTTSITQQIALSGSTKIYVCSLSLIASAATVFSVTGGTGTNCGTPAALIGTTSATHGLSLAANGGMTLGNGAGTVAVTAAGSELCLVQSGAGDLVGNLTYVQQ